jgi:hypothetical protein
MPPKSSARSDVRSTLEDNPLPYRRTPVRNSSKWIFGGAIGTRAETHRQVLRPAQGSNHITLTYGGCVTVEYFNGGPLNGHSVSRYPVPYLALASHAGRQDLGR